MARPQKWPPTIHVDRWGQAYVRIVHPDGTRRVHTLGKADTAEARQAYATLLQQFEDAKSPGVDRERTFIVQLDAAYRLLLEKLQEKYRTEQGLRLSMVALIEGAIEVKLREAGLWPPPGSAS
jgi:hypothetical protein